MELPDYTAESYHLLILLCLASKILSRTYEKRYKCQWLAKLWKLLSGKNTRGDH